MNDDWQAPFDFKWIIIAFLAILVTATCIMPRVYGHDHEHPELSDWYSGLRGQGNPESGALGSSCCDGPPSGPDDHTADAMHLAEDGWRRTPDGQHYMVEVPVDAKEFDKWRRGESFERKWVEVPDFAIVTVPNEDGRPLVWPSCGSLGCSVRCFMPGAGG